MQIFTFQSQFWPKPYYTTSPILVAAAPASLTNYVKYVHLTLQAEGSDRHKSPAVIPWYQISGRPSTRLE